MYQSIRNLSEFSPPGKRVQNPHLRRAYKTSKIPTPTKNETEIMYVKPHNFIIFRWLKDKLGLQLRVLSFFSSQGGLVETGGSSKIVD